MLPALLLLLAAAGPVAAPSSISARVDAILRDHRGHWGIHVLKLSTNQTLYEKCANCYFLPASNTKLYSTAFALSRLGRDHRFRTVVAADEAPGANGVLRGSLRVIGSGDPTFSRRAYPYSRHSPILPNITALEDLADQIAATGLTRVEGDLIGDDTAWAWEPSPDGWSHDDFTWDYGAPISALSLNDNVINLLIRPGAIGQAARLTFTPALEYFTVDNRIETVAAGPRDIRVLRMTGSRQLLLTGRMPLGSPWQADLAVDDPAQYFAEALKHALEQRGITFSGRAVARHRSPAHPVFPQPPAHILTQRVSPPVAEILTIVNKVSQNQVAEIMMRAAGGVEAMRQWLAASAGISRSEFRFEDGSGLSRLTQTTPRASTQLLARMANNEDFLATLPIGGIDGSLARRALPRVKAKTGGMTGVNTLSGYIDSRRHGRLAFSIMVNNDPNYYAATSAYIDRVVMLLSE